MPGLIYIIGAFVAVLTASVYSLWAKKEMLRKAVTVFVSLISINAAIMAAGFLSSQMAVVTELRQQTQKYEVELRKIQLDHAFLNERLATIQRLSSQDPCDSSRVTELIQRADRELELIRDTTTFMPLIIFDAITGKPASGTFFRFSFETLDGQRYEDTVVVDNIGSVSLRIPEQFVGKRIKVYYQMLNSTHAEGRMMLEVPSAPIRLEIPVKNRE